MTFPGASATLIQERQGSTGFRGRASSFDSFPASLDRVKGVRVEAAL
jgi:hypothetical protein